jgi:hypothetical protein
MFIGLQEIYSTGDGQQYRSLDKSVTPNTEIQHWCQKCVVERYRTEDNRTPSPSEKPIRKKIYQPEYHFPQR